jgi:hypothetical protein
MAVLEVFGDAGTSIVGSFFKNSRLQWLPGCTLIASIILRVLSQEPLFPHMKEAKELVAHIQRYVPLVTKYDVPIINFLFVSFTLAIIILCILQFFSHNLYWLKWSYFVHKWATISIVLMLPTCVPYASLLILASAADINQALARGDLWLWYLLMYLYGFSSYMFNSIYSWAKRSD